MKDYRSIMALTALVLMALFSTIGCSKMPTANDDPATTTLLKRNLSALKVTDAVAHIDTVLNAAEGGVVTLLDVELDFPPKALPNDTLISIDIPDLAVFANDFGTNGLIFNVPVRVTMSYRDADLSGLDETTIKMAWYNPHSGNWDIIDCHINPLDMTVTAFVSHFSAYALITDE